MDRGAEEIEVASCRGALAIMTDSSRIREINVATSSYCHIETVFYRYKVLDAIHLIHRVSHQALTLANILISRIAALDRFESVAEKTRISSSCNLPVMLEQIS